MMRRRPPGERGQPGQRRLLFALVLALMPLQLVAAGPQINQHDVVDLVDVVDVVDVPDVADDTRYNSPPEANNYQPSLASLASHLVGTRETSDGDRSKKPKHKAVPTTEPTSSAAAHKFKNLKNSKKSQNSKNSSNNTNTKNTTAPDLSVRAPSPAHRDPAPLSGSELNSNSGLAGALASPHIARSLVDWEVEDYVLLATVNGDLHSVHRKTGKTLWHTESDKPVVETVHHRAAVPADDPSYTPLDHWTWAIEPSGDGAIYLMIPGSDDAVKSIGGLTDTGLTMKTIVEQVPYNDPHHPVVFMGTKDATMMTLDAVTGHVKDWYSSSDANVNDSKESCMRPNDYFDDASAGHEECAIGGTITLGRMDYKVVVYRTSDGAAIATLRYSEWGPNNYDNDLHRQYRSPMDNRYITGKPSGDVYGFNVAPSTGAYKLSFTHHLDTPVVRVFDIARPPNVPLSSNPDLALLPQPPPPAINDEDAGLRRSSVFVNETEAGDWYALSGTSYPLIVDAPDAQCTRVGWWDRHPASTPQEHRPAMAGKHTLASGALNSGRRRRLSLPTLPGIDAARPGSDPEHYYPEIDGYDERVPLTLPGRSEVVEADPATTAESVIEKVKELPQVAGRRVFDLFSNPVLLFLLAVAVFFYRHDLYVWSKRQARQWTGQADDEAEEDVKDETVDGKVGDKANNVLRETDVAEAKTEAKADTMQDTVSPAIESASSSPSPPSEGEGDANASAAGSAPEKEKKKNHRGRRGGAKHKKGGKAAALRSENSMTQNDDETGPDGQPPSVDEVVGKAKQLGAERTTLHPEPDVVTVSYNTVPGKSDMEEVSSPILRMGSLEVNTNVQLGTGSNGTIVFAGKFDGREVAVKRMLIQFYDIASQETKLLRESDDHPNVIRYYAQQQHANFHYIALELCRASLADVIERSFLFRDIAEAGERDLPSVLYQITNGLHHLHARNIVHRDLKPQNILVNRIDGEAMPRMLISDFGLCKKLDGGQSSFGATTAHAAGTSGWRAPELLLDDDERDNNNHQHMATMVEAAMTTQSGGSNYNHTNNGTGASGSGHAGHASTTRRVTKSIDIFSLGLVFHYVLTKGYHPFDVGDRYMREVNIRKDTYKLDRLDVLGNYAYEAKDLVERMISRTPGHRPRTREIMSHPFFWSPKKRLAFLCDVSDHFEKEPRDPPSAPLCSLEAMAADVCGKDFLKKLPREFIESLGKQRKYTGTRLLDLLRALRNKRNHYEDMSPALRQMIGGLPEGYLTFWTTRFTSLLIRCWRLGIQEEWEKTDRFSEYYRPPVPA